MATHRVWALWLLFALPASVSGGGIDFDSGIPLTAPAGKALLRSASHAAPFLDMAMHFVTELPGQCGPSTAAMVLNALGVPAPVAEELSNVTFNFTVHYWDQHNVFNSTCGRAAAANWNGSIEEVAGLVSCQGVPVEVVRAKGSTAAAFRDTLKSSFVEGRPKFVAVNFARKYVGQIPSIGHHSPVGAYDAASDMVLVMDVARYKYPPVWHTLEHLFYAMAVEDEEPSEHFRNFTTPRGWWVASPPQGPQLSDVVV